jgi:hypothetical protein
LIRLWGCLVTCVSALSKQWKRGRRGFDLPPPVNGSGDVDKFDLLIRADQILEGN